MKRVIFLLISLFIILINEATHAQGPPIFTETPIMLGLGGGGVRTFGKFISKEDGKIYIQPIVVPYNIFTIWQVGAVIPLINIDPIESSSQFGLSDIQIFTKVQLHKKDGKGKTFRTILKVSESFPTGNTSEQPSLGTGEWQTRIGLASAFVSINYGVYAEIAYVFETNGLANNFVYNLAFSYPLLPQKYPPSQLNVSVEFNGILYTESRANILFISPGLQYITGRRFLVETGLQLPIAQSAEESQRIRYMYTLGVRVLIF